jgi:hypothetical protein
MLGKPSRRTRKRLEEAGRKANATVVEIAEKGMAVTHGAEGVVANTELAMKTTLKVQPEGEPEFEVKETFRYPQMAVPSAGSTIPVIYDPEDHGKIMLDDSPEAQQAAVLSGAGIDAGAIGDAVANAQKMQQQAMQGGAMNMGATGMPGAADPVDKLEKLQALKEKGALTDSEFEAQKAKILGEG